MAASYPSSVKSFTDLVDGTTFMEGVNVNVAYDEVEAIEAFVGAPSTAQTHHVTLITLLIGYIHNCQVEFKGVADLYVRAGEIMIPDASGNLKLRRNPSDTTVTWADIDTGAEAGSTTYYVYAVGDATATTFTVTISTNSSTPTGKTFYRRIGSFYNDGSSNIIENRVTNEGASLELQNIENVAGMTAVHGDVLFYDTNGRWNRLAAGTDEEFLQTKGNAADPIWSKIDLADTGEITGTLALGNGGTGATTLAGAKIAMRNSGNYTGNATANTTVAHGLGFTPVFVYSSSQIGNTADDGMWATGMANIMRNPSGQVIDDTTGTPDATNFYLGDATANRNTVTFYWVAFA